MNEEAKEYDFEVMVVLDKLSGILKQHNSVLQELLYFRENYPYLLAPNVFDSLESHLKDNITILYREFQNLHSRRKDRYEKKYVCKNCHQVFFSPLPNGLCDQCRAEQKSPEFPTQDK